MSEHKPEFPETKQCVYDENNQGWVLHEPSTCIQAIDGLTEDEAEAFIATVKTSGSIALWQDGFTAGLDAAREAVVGMNLPSGITYLSGTDRKDLAEMVRRAALDLIDGLRGQRETSVQRSFEKSLDSDSTLTTGQMARLEKAAALAAIDALREKP